MIIDGVIIDGVIIDGSTPARIKCVCGVYNNTRVEVNDMIIKFLFHTR